MGESIMEKLDFLNKWLARIYEVIGIDGVLHIAICGWIVSYGHVWGTDGGALATLIVIILSALKEFGIDEKYDLKDLMCDGFGIILAWLLYVPVDMLGFSRFIWY